MSACSSCSYEAICHVREPRRRRWLRQQIEAATQATQRALYDYAATARHQAITAGMLRGGERVLQLIAQGRDKEARALMESDWWTQQEHDPLDPHHILGGMG